MKHSDSIEKGSASASRIRSIDVISIMLVLSCVIMGVFFFSLSNARAALIVPCLGALAIIIAWACYRLRHASDAFVTNALFPVVLIVLALVYGFTFPPGTIPDEPFHFKASYYASNLIENPGNPHLIRIEDEDDLLEGGVINRVFDKNSVEVVKLNLGPFATQEGLTENEELNAFFDGLSIEGTFVQQKLAPAIGILIAKVIGLNSYWLYSLGMVFNLLYGALLIIFSVRITPIGKKIFMAVALLPMTLQLLGSHSYDVGTLGLSFLLIAFILRAMHREGKIGVKELLAIAITGCLLTPCKVVYSLLIFLVVLIPNARFSSNAKAVILKAVLIVLPFAILALFYLPSILSMLTTSHELDGAAVPSGSEGAVQSYVLGDLLSNPVMAVSLFMNTFLVKGWDYLLTFVGSDPAWLQENLMAPHYVTAMLLTLVGLSAMPSPEDRKVLSPGARAVVFIVFTIAVLAVMLALCLDHTPNTLPFIEGVQGRYFLPFAPLLLLALRSRAFRSGRRMSFALIAAFIAIDMTYIGFIFTRLL